MNKLRFWGLHLIFKCSIFHCSITNSIYEILAYIYIYRHYYVMVATEKSRSNHRMPPALSA